MVVTQLVKNFAALDGIVVRVYICLRLALS